MTSLDRSAAAPDVTLFRMGAVAFGLSGAANILLELLSASQPTLALSLNFVGAGLGVAGVTALYLRQRSRAGRLGLVAYPVLLAGLLGVCGFLFANAVIVSGAGADTASELLEGHAGPAIFASVLLYVLGVVLMAAATWRAQVFPAFAALLWAVGTLPTPFALALPPSVIAVTEGVASVGVIWLAVALWQSVAGRQLAPSTPAEVG